MLWISSTVRPAVRAGAFILLALAATACEIESASDDTAVTISVIGTNDFHGALLQENGYSGLPGFAGYVDNLRANRRANGGAVVLIDAGDMWQGTLESNISEGSPVLRAYEALRYDAVTIGNHEFDYGPVGPLATPASDADDPQGALRARASEADFPFLAANLIDSKTGTAVSWENVSPSVIVRKAGVSIGVIGVVTEYALSTTIVANVKGLTVAPLLTTIRQEAKELRQEGADVIIVTAHAGGECTNFDDPDDLSSCNLDSEIFRLARELPAGLIDVIVGGHVHKGIAHNVNGISIISSFSRGRAFGRVDLSVDLATDQRSAQVRSKTVYAPQQICSFQGSRDDGCGQGSAEAARASYAGALVVDNTIVAGIIDHAVDEVRQFKERNLGVLIESEFKKATRPESPLGNMLTDIMLDRSEGADIAIHNTVGGVRAGIPAGALTFGDIYEMFPFDNVMVQLSIDGAAMTRLFEAQLQSGQWRAGMSGLHLDAECDGSELTVSLVRNDGSKVQDHEVLTVVTNDFLATGGDAIFTPIMPEDGFTFAPGSPRYRDEIVEWMKLRGGILRPADFYDATNPRFVFPGEVPVVCAADSKPSRH